MATKKATAAKTSGARQSAARPAAKRSNATAASGRNVAVKTSTPKKTSAKKSAPRQPAARKTAEKKPATKRTTAASSVATPAKVPAKRSAPRKTSTSDKYTDPGLRERIKAKVVREDKGGRPGQWSARKAQLVAHEYEAEGGKYKGGRGDAQKSLTSWGEEHWTTKDGKPARRKDGMHRYLPAEAWKALSPSEKRSTEKKKLAADKQGKQFVANIQAAVKARRKAEK